MIDPPAIIRTYLLSQSAVTALTDTRIWAERYAPLPTYKPYAGAFLVFYGSGGVVDYNSRVQKLRFAFKAYAADEPAANALYRTLYDVLHDQQYGKMVHAEVEIAGRILREPATANEWVFNLSIWRCVFLTE